MAADQRRSSIASNWEGVMVSASSAVSVLNFDPYDLKTAINPYPLYRQMRDNAPLYYNEEHDFFALSRYSDIERAVLDPKTFINSRGVTLGLLKANIEMPPGTVILEDPPTHTIHRGLLSKMFAPKQINALEPRIRQLCGEVLDPLVGLERFDFVTDVANRVPMKVISMLVGIPVSDEETVRDFYDGSRGVDFEDRGDILGGSMFAEYIDWRADHPSDDIMTELANAEFVDQTGVTRHLTREELLAYISIVAAAGNETTKYLIGYTADLLAKHPDQRRLLVEDPSLTRGAVEEILRYESVVHQLCRYVARDVELYGRKVPAGSILALPLASANHNERHYDDPERFDIARTGQIVSFGF